MNTLLEALTKIANTQANGNSDPDVMEEALDTAMEIASEALRKHKETPTEKTALEIKLINLLFQTVRISAECLEAHATGCDLSEEEIEEHNNVIIEADAVLTEYEHLIHPMVRK